MSDSSFEEEDQQSYIEEDQDFEDADEEVSMESDDEDVEDADDAEEVEGEAGKLAAEEKQIKELLKHTSYETLLKLRKEDNQISTFSKKIKKEKVAPISLKPGQKKEDKPKSKSKSKPKERNAKVPVSRFQTIMETKKEKGRDPRFDGMSGRLNLDLYKKSYGFLIDQKQDEIKTLQNEIRQATRGSAKKRKQYSEEDVKKLKQILGQNKDEMNRFKKNEQVSDIKRQHKKQAEKGHKPFYLKEGELKKKVLEKQFEDLDKRKKLAKTLDEKKKRQSQKMLYEFKKVQKRTLMKNQGLNQHTRIQE